MVSNSRSFKDIAPNRQKICLFVREADFAFLVETDVKTIVEQSTALISFTILEC